MFTTYTMFDIFSFKFKLKLIPHGHGAVSEEFFVLLSKNSFIILLDFLETIQICLLSLTRLLFIYLFFKYNISKDYLTINFFSVFFLILWLAQQLNNSFDNRFTVC